MKEVYEETHLSKKCSQRNPKWLKSERDIQTIPKTTKEKAMHSHRNYTTFVSQKIDRIFRHNQPKRKDLE